MKALIELSNFAVGTVSSKRTTPSETEGEVEVSPKIFLEKIFYRAPSGTVFSLKTEVELLAK